MNATLTVDAQGSLRLPDFMLTRLHVDGGGRVQAEMCDDGILIKEEDAPKPKIVWKDGLRVIEGWDGFDAVKAIDEMREDLMERMAPPRKQP